MTAASSRLQMAGADWLWFGLFMASLVAALVLGIVASEWLASPLRTTRFSLEYGQRLSEQRQRRLCVVAALACYYIPALIVIQGHAGWSAVEPYLRAHLFDGFGCAALFGIAFNYLREPLARPAAGAGLSGWAAEIRLARLADRRTTLAAFRLTWGAVLIAAASAWVAGGGWLKVLVAAGCTFVPVQSFWGLVANGVGFAPFDPGAPAQPQLGEVPDDTAGA